jgi:hypothetical protein
MLKFIGGALLGVFVSSLILEMLRRRQPRLIQAVEHRAKLIADELMDEPNKGLFSNGNKA